ncbi:hypothetical protein B0O80DRAFT_444787 [Mortierella sp. GBAus27b]|nr:hypothetical protein B0O80DRAFT_444787 [Mortierella sp. GBAus27b]
MVRLRRRRHMVMMCIRGLVAWWWTMGRRRHDSRWMRIASVYTAEGRAGRRPRRGHGWARSWRRSAHGHGGWGQHGAPLAYRVLVRTVRTSDRWEMMRE